MPYASVTVDLDGLNCYRAIHGLEPAIEREDPAYTIGVSRLLEFFEQAQIPATLFVIGRDVDTPTHRGLLEAASQQGHELANHTFFHDYALRTKLPADIETDVSLGEDAIASVASPPVGFRTPGYNVDAQILGICESRGYLYDSSIFPCPPYYFAKAGIMGLQRLRGRPSRSAMTALSTLRAPISAYRPNIHAPWSRGDANLIEVPMCLVPGARFPVIGTSLHLMGKTGFDAAWPLIRRANPHVLNLEFHAIDFMDDQDAGTHDLVGVQPDLAVPWQKKHELYAHVFGKLREHFQMATLEDAVRQTASSI